MEYKIFRFTIRLLILFLFVSFGFQLIQFFYQPRKTQVALSYYFENKFSLEGIAIKQEKMMEKTHDGVMKYHVQNATKISKNTVIGETYQSFNELKNSFLHTRLNQKIEVLQEVEKKKNRFNSPNITKIAPTQVQLELLDRIEHQKFDDLYDHSLRYLSELLQYEQLIDLSMSCQDELLTLTEQRNKLIVTDGKKTTSPLEGYFTKTVDGYENIFTKEVLKDLSTENLLKLFNQKVDVDLLDQKKIGKVITSTKWNFFAIAPHENLRELEPGQTVLLRLLNRQSTPIQATIVQINTSQLSTQQQAQGTILLEINYLNDQMIDIRKESAEILLQQGDGIKVSREAIRMDKNTQGVYIKRQNSIMFKKIDIIYEDEDFVVSRFKTDSEFLQLYDEMILYASQNILS